MALEDIHLKGGDRGLVLELPEGSGDTRPTDILYTKALHEVPKDTQVAGVFSIFGGGIVRWRD